MMGDDILPRTSPNRIVLYDGADGKVTVNVVFACGNFWRPQRAIAATLAKMETVQIEGEKQKP